MMVIANGLMRCEIGQPESSSQQSHELSNLKNRSAVQLTSLSHCVTAPAVVSRCLSETSIITEMVTANTTQKSLNFIN